jgi:hypothetical protein
VGLRSIKFTDNSFLPRLPFVVNLTVYSFPALAGFLLVIITVMFAVKSGRRVGHFAPLLAWADVTVCIEFTGA